MACFKVLKIVRSLHILISDIVYLQIFVYFCPIGISPKSDYLQQLLKQ